MSQNYKEKDPESSLANLSKFALIIFTISVLVPLATFFDGFSQGEIQGSNVAFSDVSSPYNSTKFINKGMMASVVNRTGEPLPDDEKSDIKIISPLLYDGILTAVKEMQNSIIKIQFK